MRRELKYTLRLSEHLKEITLRHFVFVNPYLSQSSHPSDAATYRAYIRDVIVEHPYYSKMTSDQKYLHDLGGIVTPILSAYRTRKRIPRLHPRTGKVTASAILEECGQRLAMDAFNFKERIKLFGASASEIISKPHNRVEFQTAIGLMVRTFVRSNARLMKYRNFIVHGPKGRVDEFANLRSWELAGIFLHDDLWLDYNNEFEMMRSEWTDIAKHLLRSMEEAVAATQLLNESSIEQRAFGFCLQPTLS